MHLLFVRYTTWNLTYGHIWPYMVDMRKGNPEHVYLNTDQRILLDIIGETMGKRQLGVIANRSQLIATAIRNFIKECRQEEDLREAIDEYQKLRTQQAVEKPVENS